jgi:hypothetical protein
MISCHSSGRQCRRSSASAGGELQHIWRTVAAQLARLLRTRQRPLDRSLAVGMMQICPMRGWLDQSAFVPEHGVVRLRDQRQGGRRIRPTHLLFEHALTLSASSDSSSVSPAWVETSGLSAA